MNLTFVVALVIIALVNFHVGESRQKYYNRYCGKNYKSAYLSTLAKYKGLRSTCSTKATHYKRVLSLYQKLRRYVQSAGSKLNSHSQALESLTKQLIAVAARHGRYVRTYRRYRGYGDDEDISPVEEEDVTDIFENNDLPEEDSDVQELVEYLDQQDSDSANEKLEEGDVDEEESEM